MRKMFLEFRTERQKLDVDLDLDLGSSTCMFLDSLQVALYLRCSKTTRDINLIKSPDLDLDLDSSFC